MVLPERIELSTSPLPRAEETQENRASPPMPTDFTRPVAAPVPGAEITAPYPFVRSEYGYLEEDGYHKELSWKPGVEVELVPPDGGSGESVCDGWGSIILTVVGTFKPGRYPERVFYTRRWRAPDGREFGKGDLRVATVQKFARLAGGYRFAAEVRSREAVR